jgi:hypothetical protein
MVGWSTQLHGAKWTGTASQFIVTAGYGCDMLMTDMSANNLVSFYSTCPYNTADIEEFKMLRTAADTFYNLCPTTDSVMISTIYPGANVQWYRNNTLLPDTGDTLYAGLAGNYRALVEIEATGSFMWSEPITITNVAVPVVHITQATNDTLICPTETIVLNGASGGTLQWYRNGAAISGATSSTYSATMSGAYNQMKTNLSGCPDTSATPYVIVDQASGCATGLNTLAGTTFNIYPNPFESNLVIESAETINAITVLDVLGKPVYRMDNVRNTKAVLDLHALKNGAYLIRISTASGNFVHKVQK